MIREREGVLTYLWEMFNIRTCFQFSDGDGRIFSKTTCNRQTPYNPSESQIKQEMNAKKDIRVASTDDATVIGWGFL
jgi:hypothetical protein